MTRVLRESRLTNRRARVGRFVVSQSARKCLEQLEARLLLSGGTGPTATLVSAPNLYTSGGTDYLFSLDFAGASPINVSTLGGGNVRVAGTNGFNQPVSLVSYAPLAGSASIRATYDLRPPGGTWDAGDSANYSIVLQPNQVGDQAGNFAAGGTLGAFTAAIAGTPYQPDLASASDTGISSHDKITAPNNSAPAKSLSFTVVGTLPGALVGLYADGKLVGSTVAVATTTAVTTDGATTLTDGTHSITARQTGLDGRQTPDSAPLAITVESSAPSVPAAPHLQSASDTGASNSDGITSSNAPQFDVAGSPYYRVYRNGALVSDPWQTGAVFSSAQLPDGTYQFTVTAVDAAGNESARSAATTVRIDTQSPSASATLPDESSVGSAFYSFTVSYSDDQAVDPASIGSGDVTVGGPNGFSASATLLSLDGTSAGPVRTATYQVAAPGGSWDAADDGTYTVTLQPDRVKDLAGNAAAGRVLGTFVAAADALGTPDLLAASDSGLSSTDDITNFNNASASKALQFQVLNTLPGATVTIYADGHPIGSAVASGTTTTLTTDGTSVLADGVHAVTARQTPPGGTQSPDTPPLSITIDTTPPVVPAPQSDQTGFSVTTNEPGTVHLVGSAEDGGDLAANAPSAGTYPVTFPPAPGFAQPVAYPVSGGLTTIPGDFNGDGITDLLVTSQSTRTLTLLIGKGDGTFTARNLFMPGSGGSALYAAVGDVNGDGKADLLVGPDGTPFHIGDTFEFPGNGDGTFQQTTEISTQGLDNATDNVVLADLNHDGKLDIVAIDDLRMLSTMLGNGDGTFQNPQQYQYTSSNIGFPQQMVVADLNGDGNLDVAVATMDLAGGIKVFFGNGDGTLTYSGFYPTGYQFSYGDWLSSADFNGDGKPDLLISISRGVGAPPMEFLNNGDGTFKPGVSLPAPGALSGATVFDFNRDGKPDVAGVYVDSSFHRTLVIDEGNGDGTFGQPILIPLPPLSQDAPVPAALTVGDFNHDGRADLAISDETTHRVQILLGTGGPLPAGSHSVYAYATDLAGNRSADSQPTTVTIGGTPPAVRPPIPRPTHRPVSAVVSAAQTVQSASVQPAATDATPTGALLADIDPRTAPSTVSDIAAVNGTAYILDQGANGAYTLWASDGTPSGTTALKSLPDSSVTPHFLGALGPVELFAAGTGIWRTDGTADGTYVVSPVFTTSRAVAINNFLYFAGADSRGVELWRSDGSLAGTQIVKDINPGQGSSNPTDLVNVFGTLFFAADDGTHASELWSSDGTAAGTVLVKNFGGGTPPSGLVNVAGSLFFTTRDSTGASHLWKTDGTGAGTVGVIVSGLSASSAFSQLTDVAGNLFFATSDGSLWVSDGTTAGTTRLATGINPTNLQAVRSLLYFVANGDQLWESDASSAQPIVTVSQMSQLTTAGGKLFFTASDAFHGDELWVSDGTAAGTRLVQDINPGPQSSAAGELTGMGGSVFFVADDGLHGTEPWVSDGTTQGTQLLVDANPTPLSSSPSFFVAFNHNAFFVASGPQGSGLYKSDGTAGGTVFVTAIASQPFVGPGGVYFLSSDGTLYVTGGNPGDLRRVAPIGAGAQYRAYVNGILYFTVPSGAGSILWRSDGTAAGTFSLALPADSRLFDFTPADNYLLFYQFNGGSFGSVWRTDGTVAGTFKLADNAGIWDGANQTLHASAAAVGHYVVFFGNGLFATDGSVAGTRLLGEPPNSSPESLILRSGGFVYYLSVTSSGAALSKTDGTPSGTTLLGQMSTGGQHFPYGLTDAAGLVYFWDATQSETFTLWRSDGTPAGTFALHSYGDNAGAAAPTALVPVGTSVYFSAMGPNGGRIPWQSDGTVAGTVPAASIPPTPSPVMGVFVDGSFFYANTDAQHGTELWIQPTPGIPSAPASPSGLQAVPANGGAVDLSWTDNANNDLSLRLERSTSPTFDVIDESVVLMPGTTGYRDTGALGSTAYYYRISAANLGGISSPSNVATATFGLISGRLFQDSNNNGIADPGEPPLAGWVVYADLNRNGVLDPQEPSTTTNSTGGYTLGGLVAGSYVIRQQLPPGYAVSTPATGPSASVSTGQNLPGPTFGDVPISSVTLGFDYLLKLAQGYGRPGTFANGDLNGDDQVNFADLLLLAQNYGHSLAAASDYSLLSLHRRLIAN